MFVRPLSVAAVGALALGVAALFGASGCDQIEDWAHEVIDHNKPGGAGGSTGSMACASTDSCPEGLRCTTEEGVCNSPPGCGASGGARPTTGAASNEPVGLVACPAVCYGTCSKDVPPPPPPEMACASTESCPSGTVCSTEQGACNAPPGCGSTGPGTASPTTGVAKTDLVGCPAVCYGTCVSVVHPTPAPGLCKTDSDCRIYSDYCGGCSCRAATPAPDARACTSMVVQCLVDPCAQKTAVCVNGQCQVQDAPTRQ